MNSVKAIEAAGQIGKWVKVSADELAAIEDSIRDENLLRNMPPKSAPNFRHYVRSGYVCVTQQECEAHPDDLPAAG